MCGGASERIIARACVGSLFSFLSLFILLIIVIPWEKWAGKKSWDVYITPALLTIIIGILSWNTVVSIFPKGIPNPYLQPIQTATADVVVNVDVGNTSSYTGTTVFGGAITGLFSGQKEIIELGASQYTQIPTSPSSVQFHATCNLLGYPSTANMSLLSLKDSKYALIFFKLPKENHVTGGKLTITLNSNVIVDIPIPEQITTRDDYITVFDVTPSFVDFK